MISLSRRRFVQGAAALPFATWLAQQPAFAQSTQLVRYDIASPQGLDMLTTYAQAMNTMLARPETDPTNEAHHRRERLMSSVVLAARETQQALDSTVTGTVLLVLAAMLLLAALDMLRHALSPLREVLRALAAAGAMTALVLLAFGMVVAALVMR